MKTRLKTFVNLSVWRGSSPELVRHIFGFAQQNKTCRVVTVNAEMLLAASENAPVAAAVRSADVLTADTVTAHWFFHGAPRIPGADLAEQLVMEAGKRGVPIILFGGASAAVREQATQFITSKGGHVVHAEAGPIISYDAALPETELQRLLKIIEQYSPALILIGFGHGKQERAMDFFARHCTNNHISVGVGGTFEMWAGVTPRAPRVMRACGLEWLWRLCIEPKRFPRIIRATLIFPMRVLCHL